MPAVPNAAPPPCLGPHMTTCQLWGTPRPLLTAPLPSGSPARLPTGNPTQMLPENLKTMNLSHLGGSPTSLEDWPPCQSFPCVLTVEPLAAPAPFTPFCSRPHGVSESIQWPGQLRKIHLSSCDTIGLFNNPQGPPPTNSRGNKLCVCE